MFLVNLHPDLIVVKLIYNHPTFCTSWVANVTNKSYVTNHFIAALLKFLRTVIS